MKRLFGFLDRFLPVLIVLTVVTFLAYVGLQQVYRQSADDPQIQLAQDASAALDQGATPQRIVGTSTVDIASSLAPFLMIWDASGTLVASSAALDGQWPQVPSGVLEYARQRGENRVTWQPEPNVRIASVVVYSTSGYVLAGRSLLEAESRVARLGLMAGLAWLGGVCALAIAAVALTFIAARLNR